MANDKDFKIKNGLQVGGNVIEAVGTISGQTLDLSTGNVFSYTPAADTTFVFSNPPASGTAYGMTLKVTGADVGTPYDLANASYDSVSFSVATQDTLPTDLFFKPDGTKMYVTGGAGQDINEYDLSSAWDASTASYVQNFSVSSQDTVPTQVFFKPDGIKMYMIGRSNQGIFEYDLSSAWDVSTASYLQSFSVSSQGTRPQSLFFRPDGTNVYITGDSSDAVHEYSLSSAWDISSASYVQTFSVSAQETNPQGLFFKSDGTKMYVIGSSGDDVNEYSLSSAWDISTASYVRNFSVSAQETNPQGVFFKSDGTKMYVVGWSNSTVYQYTTGFIGDATFTYPTSVDWPGGTAPDAPADGETDTLEFLTLDGGTVYYGRLTGNSYS